MRISIVFVAMVVVGLAGRGTQTRSFLPTIAAAVGASTVEQPRSVLVSSTSEGSCKDGSCRKPAGDKSHHVKASHHHRRPFRGFFRRLIRRR